MLPLLPITLRYTCNLDELRRDGTVFAEFLTKLSAGSQIPQTVTASPALSLTNSNSTSTSASNKLSRHKIPSGSQLSRSSESSSFTAAPSEAANALAPPAKKHKTQHKTTAPMSSSVRQSKPSRFKPLYSDDEANMEASASDDENEESDGDSVEEHFEESDSD